MRNVLLDGSKITTEQNLSNAIHFLLLNTTRRGKKGKGKGHPITGHEGPERGVEE
jgi:hypothetical protein